MFEIPGIRIIEKSGSVVGWRSHLPQVVNRLLNQGVLKSWSHVSPSAHVYLPAAVGATIGGLSRDEEDERRGLGGALVGGLQGAVFGGLTGYVPGMSAVTRTEKMIDTLNRTRSWGQHGGGRVMGSLPRTTPFII